VTKQVFLLICIGLGFLKAQSQSPEYTQVFTNLLYANPAFAGTNVCPRFYMNYRDKYVSLGSAYQTYFCSYDQYSDALKGDVAISVIDDIQAKGVINNSLFGAIFAKGVKIESNTIFKIGVEADYIMQKINTTNLSYPDMIDPFYGVIYNTSEATINESFYKLNVNAGILLYNEKQFVGISLYNINQPTISFATKHYILQHRICAHYSRNVSLSPRETPVNNRIMLNPLVVLNLENGNSQLLYGANFTYHQLLIGTFFKQNLGENYDSFSFLVGYIEKKYKFAYNCDVSMSRAGGSLFDTHEISFTYYFECLEKRKKERAIKCPGI